MIIPIGLPHLFVEGSTPLQNARALRRFLALMVNLNIDFLQDYPATPSLYRSRVVYARTLVWEPIPALYARRKGDCKSLATALVAQYRLVGIDAQPVFRFIEDPLTKQLLFHILVQTASGWEDPSKILGMGEDEIAPFYASGSYGDPVCGSVT